MNFLVSHIHENREKYFKLMRYLLSGGTGAFVHLSILHILVEYVGIWYIFSAIIAYVCAFLISFLLQKFWTFQESSKHVIHIQMMMHFILGITNLFINTLVLYVMVDIFHFHYLISQIIISATIAVFSFFVYKYVIFKTKENI